MKRGKWVIIGVVLLLLCLLSGQAAYAEPADPALQAQTVPIASSIQAASEQDYLFSLAEALPAEVREYLDGSLWREMDGRISAEAFDATFWQRTALKLLTKALNAVLKDMATLFGLVLLLSLLNGWRDTVAGAGVKMGVRYASVLVLATVSFQLILRQWQATEAYLDALGVFVNSAAPIAIAICLSGGQVTAAAVGNTTLLTALGLLDGMVRQLLYPVLSVCYGLNFVAVIGGREGMGFSAVSNTVRKCFSWLMGLMMTFLGFILSHQTTLAAATDGMASKTVGYAAGNLIPVVGTALSEAMQMVVGSLQYVKGAFGALAATAIVILTLPRFFSVWLTGVAFSLSASVGEVLGCSEEAGFLRSVKGLTDFLLSLITCSGVFFIFAVTVLMKTAAVMA